MLIISQIQEIRNNLSRLLGKVKVTDGTNDMPAMDAAARRGYVTVTDGTNSLSTMDAVGRAGFQKITDGTDTLAVTTTDQAIQAVHIPSRTRFIVFDHGTVVADWSEDIASHVTQTNGYNFWVTGIAVRATDDLTAEIAVQPVLVDARVQSPAGTNIGAFQVQVGNSSYLDIKSACLKISSNTTFRTVVRLGGATNVQIVCSLYGFEEAA